MLPGRAGTLKSFLGLSASLMSTIYVAAFQPDGLSFLLFVACLPVVVGFATIPFLNQVPYLEACEIEDQHQYMTTGGYLSPPRASYVSTRFLPVLKQPESLVHPATVHWLAIPDELVVQASASVCCTGL